jgi:hypothetical protein
LKTRVRWCYLYLNTSSMFETSLHALLLSFVVGWIYADSLRRGRGPHRNRVSPSGSRSRHKFYYRGNKPASNIYSTIVYLLFVFSTIVFLKLAYILCSVPIMVQTLHHYCDDDTSVLKRVAAEGIRTRVREMILYL